MVVEKWIAKERETPGEEGARGESARVEMAMRLFGVASEAKEAPIEEAVGEAEICEEIPGVKSDETVEETEKTVEERDAMMKGEWIREATRRDHVIDERHLDKTARKW